MTAFTTRDQVEDLIAELDLLAVALCVGVVRSGPDEAVMQR